LCCSLVKKIVQSNFTFNHPSLATAVLGLHFNNPVGLGAGFDKNALYLNELEALGFGFVEIGTVTPKPQAGNDKPRLFRLPEDKALINRMGFNNDGVEVVKERLAKRKSSIVNRQSSMIIGGNIGKNKVTANEDAWKDYIICFKELFDVVDYFVVNVSSPNTPGLRALQEKDALQKIISELQNINNTKAKRKPLLLKIAPDLTNEQLDDIVALAYETQLDGLVATNTTIAREPLSEKSKVKSETIGMGGLSGKPVQQRSTAVVQYLHNQLQNNIPIIASGGIFTGADAKEKMNAGAALVQVWTGFIYEGPAIVKIFVRNWLWNKLHFNLMKVMRKILITLLLFTSLAVNAQWKADSIPLFKFLQANFDSVVVWHSYNNWEHEPHYLIIVRYNNLTGYFSYINPIQRFNARAMPKNLAEGFINKITKFNFLIPDTNEYFLPKPLPYPNIDTLWKSILANDLWNLKDDKAEGEGCPKRGVQLLMQTNIHFI